MVHRITPVKITYKFKQMKKKHPKLDPHLISLKQPWEATYIIAKMKKEGINVDKGNIKAAVTSVGRSRKLVYRLLRDLYGREEA